MYVDPIMSRFLPRVSFVFCSVPEQVWTQKSRNLKESHGKNKEFDS